MRKGTKQRVCMVKTQKMKESKKRLWLEPREAMMSTAGEKPGDKESPCEGSHFILKQEKAAEGFNHGRDMHTSAS